MAKNARRERIFKTAADAAKEGNAPAVRALKSFEGSHAIDDPFVDTYQAQAGANSFVPIKPPFNLNALSAMLVENFMLGQCVAAMVANVVGHGYTWEYIGPDGSDPTAPEAQREREVLDGLIQRPNLEGSWSTLATASMVDRETFGMFYWEIGRDAQGRITAMDHLPAHSMRITNKDADQTEVVAVLPRDGKATEVRVRKRFRRYVQTFGNKKVYFKELGDPRTIDPATGLVNDTLSPMEAATEVYCFSEYNPRSVYGLPRWVAQVPSVIGSRQAELTNMDFFSENAVPAMALLVSGGMVTQASIDQIDGALTSARGRASMNRVAIIEVEGDANAAPENGTVAPPRVEIKPLGGDRMQDGQFLKYLEACGLFIRSAFRLPPMFVGLSEDVNFASAKVGFEVAESQVFGPGRKAFDEFVNIHILTGWGPKFWRYQSRPAMISDPADVIEAMKAFDAMGAMTPNVAIRLANQFFNLDLPAVTAPWGEWPFTIVTALSAKGQLVGMDALMSERALKQIEAGLAAAEALAASGGSAATTGNGGKDKAQSDGTAAANADANAKPTKEGNKVKDKAKKDQEEFERALASDLIRRVADLVTGAHGEAV